MAGIAREASGHLFHQPNRQHHSAKERALPGGNLCDGIARHVIDRHFL
jgi:hypothetical protein